MELREESEARILGKRNILLVLSVLDDENVAKDFCGSVIFANNPTVDLPCFSGKTVYLYGDISKVDDYKIELKAAERVFVVRENSQCVTIETSKAWSSVDAGRLPILVQGAGVLYRRFFDSDIDYFHCINAEHTFQFLTESNKPAKAHRTGIYLTPVERDGDDLHFRLLRCSTNLSGPTENFRANDRHIVDALNQEACHIFENQAPLNHVLAQVYHNSAATEEKKQTKAKISAHADKTKDMPANGIMAFCTFYDQLDKLQPMSHDTYDFGFKGNSGLTQLFFRLKTPVANQPGCTLPSQFSVTLYPDSVFFMPLSTNRLYTHEIRSSPLDAEKLPTRLGYVVRCSSTEAVHQGGETFLKSAGELKNLETPTPEGMDELRKLYAEENRTEAFIDYADKFPFSMNDGDYAAPAYKIEDEFRQYTLRTPDTLFEELMASVEFEEMGKGRKGTVLVKPDNVRGTPIVRTTSKYTASAHCFGSAHKRLAHQIQLRTSLALGFNNALIENYTNNYAKMGAHSDQALDLEPESSIAVFSCYKYPELAPPRKLIVEPKDPGDSPFEIPLVHNSVVVFSLDANRRFKHRIVLDTSAQPPENQWLGITFRTSKTFVQRRKDQTCFEDGTVLELADADQSKSFYTLRSRENKETDFAYPRIIYTISKSDMMPPRSG